MNRAHLDAAEQLDDKEGGPYGNVHNWVAERIMYEMRGNVGDESR